MQRNAKRRAADGGGERITECDGPRHAGRSAEVIAGHETSEAADRLSKRNRGRRDIGGSPERHARMPPEEQTGGGESADESAIEVAGARDQRSEGCERREVILRGSNRQHRLRSHDGSDNRPESE